MGPTADGHPADWTLAAGIRVRSTGCAQGDLGGSGSKAERRRRAVVDMPWTVLEQVHGARVVVVERPGGSAGPRKIEGGADAAVATGSGAAVAVLTADCAPVAFASPESILGVAHVGWKGLRAGVVEATVTTMRRLGATRIEAVLGPCIHPCCYSFGSEDLDGMAARFGEQVRAVDRHGSPAFDLPGGVKAALHSSGVFLVGDADTCTGCSDGHWSWRRSALPYRQATVVWRP